jgi:hypothetical protein
MFIGMEDGEGISMEIDDLLGADLPTKNQRTHDTAHRPFSAAVYFTYI